MKVSGLRLNFAKNKKTDNPEQIDPDKSSVTIELGTVTTHRTDLIKEKLDNKDYEDVGDMFFNFDVPDCVNASSRELIEVENKLYDEYMEVVRAIDAESIAEMNKFIEELKAEQCKQEQEQEQEQYQKEFKIAC